METDKGVVTDVPAYDNAEDVLVDFRAGAIREDDRVYYRYGVIADVLGEMTDEDGKPFIAMLLIAGGSESVQPPGGMWTVQFGH